MDFAAPWDRTLKVVTVVVLAVLVWVAVIPPYRPAWAFWLKLGMSVLVTALCWFGAPTGYRLDGSVLVVRRNVGEKRIPLQGLRAARALDKPDIRGTIRTFGVGGLFGYYGKFYSGALGSHTWYVTDRSRMVLLDTAGGKYLVSPEDTKRFLAAVRSFLPAKR
jgi:hypothetical protein